MSKHDIDAQGEPIEDAPRALADLREMTHGASAHAFKTPTAIKASEVCYRRGFQQGVAFVLRQLVEGDATIEQLSKWENDELEDWRYGYADGWPLTKVICPPTARFSKGGDE